MKDNKVLKGIGNFFSVIIKTLLSYLGVFSGIFVTILGILACVILVGGIVGVCAYVKLLPSFTQAREVVFDKLVNMSKNDFISNEDTIIYDDKGEKLATVNAGHYKYVSISKVSPYLYNGYIAVEDKRFKTHAGVDVLATLRAGVTLLKNRGAITQGGSTITQQVVKNNLLDQTQTYSRKMAEVMLAPVVEQKFSKDKIMEFYCNSNYYGNRCYGVSAASKYYFGKKPIDLLPEEAAMLISLSNNPSEYNPVENYDIALAKRNSVLEKMYMEGVISLKEYKRARKTDIEVLQLTGKVTTENYLVSYAIYCAAIELMEQDNFQFKYTFEDKDDYETYNEDYSKAFSEKSDMIRSGGYKIYTSLNQKKQAKLQSAVDNGLASNTEKQSDGRYALQGSAVCIDNSNQYVKAIVGGRGTKDSYNRAFLSARQAGSSIKPLIDYGPALESGMFSPSTIVDDHEIEDGPHNSGGGYSGKMHLRDAVARSLNTVAWQVLQAITPEYGLSFLDKMHFHNISYVDNGNLAMSLGGFTNGVRTVDMAKGYATLANNGAYSERTCITKLEHVTDGILYADSKDSEDETNQVYSQDAAWMMTDILKGVFEESYGTAHALQLSNGQISAGKTGTADSGKDLWFCGYTKYYTTVVWVGFDTPRMMNAYGATIPGVIWKNYMNDIHSNLEPADFDIPETICLAKYDSLGNIIEGTEIEASETVPYGYDYFSTTILENATDYASNLEDEANQKKLLKKLKKFEKLYIDSIADYYELETDYKVLNEEIAAIADDDVRKSYMTRLKDKYNSLKDQSVEWKDVVKAYEKQKAEENALLAEETADESRVAAVKQEKESNISAAKTAIERISDKEYQPDNVDELIANAKAAVEKCKTYSDYTSLLASFQRARDDIKEKPTEDEYFSMIINDGEVTTTPAPTTSTDTITDNNSTTTTTY